MLALLSCATVALRLHAIDFLLPHYVEPDGGVLVYQLDALEGRVEDPQSHDYWGYYPLLLARIAAAAPARVDPVPATLEQHLAAAARSHVRVRETIAWLSALVVPATFLLARRFVGPWASLLAAAFAAASFLLHWFAQQSRPHAAAATFFAFAVLAALLARNRPRPWTWLVAGAAAGLAIGCIQSGVAVLIPQVVALVRRERGPRSASAWWIVPALVVAGFVGLSFYPSSGEAQTATAKLIELDLAHGMILLKGHKVMLGQFAGGGLPVVLLAMWEYEPWIFGLAAACVAIGVRRRWRHEPVIARDRLGDLWVVIAFALPYFLTIAAYQRSYQRFLLPLVPFACVGAVAALIHARGWLERRGWSAGIASACLALPLAIQATLVAKLASVRGAPDTCALAAEWIARNVDPGARILMMPGIDLPLPRSPEAARRSLANLAALGYPWIRYQAELGETALPGPLHDLAHMPLNKKDLDKVGSDAAAYVAALDGDYLVVEVYEHYWRSRTLKTIYDALSLRGQTPVARFSPDGDDRGMPLAYQDDAQPVRSHWAWRTLRARSVGPELEIYRLR